MTNKERLAQSFKEKRIEMYRALNFAEKLQAFSIDGVNDWEVLQACTIEELKRFARFFKISDEKIQQTIKEEHFEDLAYWCLISEALYLRRN